MTDRDTTTRTRARAPGVGGVFHRMAVQDRVLRPDSERTTVATTKCTKGGCKLDGERRMPGQGLTRRSPRKAPLGKPAFQPYWGKLAVRNDRGDRGNVGIIRSPIRASILPDHELIQAYGLWILFIGIMLECLGIPMPGETVLVSAALYAGSTRNLAISSVVLVAAGAATVGGMIGYVIGRSIGLRLLVRYGRYVRLDEHRLKVGQYLFLR